MTHFLMQPPHSCKQVAPIEMVPGNAGCDHVGHRQWKVEAGGGGERDGGGWDEAPHFCRIIKNFLLFYQGHFIRTLKHCFY